MNKTSLISIIISSTLIIATSCIQENNTKQKEQELSNNQKLAIELQNINNQALKIYNQDKLGTIKQAIYILDSALTICPTYQVALKNKYKLYYFLKDYNNMLITINCILDYYGRLEERECMVHKAKLYELIENQDSADFYYQKVIKSYEDYFSLIESSGRSGIVQSRLYYAECLSFYGETQRAIEYLNKTKIMYPTIDYLKDYKLKTFEEWMNSWTLNNDGTDYHDETLKEINLCKKHYISY